MRDDASIHRPPRVLVAGGTGFIGSHLYEAFVDWGVDLVFVPQRKAPLGTLVPLVLAREFA